ncbi:hypothetical protein EV401DRAFT_1888218 [Pisolithus croceorrhizus]|nr:hypothetical protein EV401DRAFT_1888218 [Pisolithus croceorrhizus]
MARQPIVIAYVVFAYVVSTDYTPSQSDGPSEVRENQRKRAAHQVGSHSEDIRESTVNLSDDRQYVFAEIPGFDDRSDWDILRRIAEWLEKKYCANVKLNGVIYTHCIADKWMSGPVLCGDKAAAGVPLVTTMWDRVAYREREGEALLLQEELVDMTRKLDETTVGQALCAQYQKLSPTVPSPFTASSSYNPPFAHLGSRAAKDVGQTENPLPRTRRTLYSTQFSNNSAGLVPDDDYIIFNNLNTENGIAGWLESKFTGISFSGILFLHSLGSDTTSGDMSMSWHLETFAKAFYNKFTVPSDIYVVPTCDPDSNLPSEILSQRLSQLKTVTEGLNGNGEHAWHVSMFPGIFKGQPETAWSAALLLLKGITQAQTEEFFISPRPALQRMPTEFPDSRLVLRDLARILFNEFKVEKRNRDLVAIITIGRIVLEYSPSEHSPRHSPLIDLADLLSEWFNKKMGNDDVDESITSEQVASNLMPPAAPYRITTLHEIAHHLYPASRRGGSILDLKETIPLRRAALERTHPLGYEGKNSRGCRLARAALSIHHPGHPDHRLSLDCLARYLETKVGKKVSPAHVGGWGAGPPNSSSFGIKDFIEEVVFEKIKTIPLRLPHTPTGVLCGRDAQISHFKGSCQYQQLLSMVSLLDHQRLNMEIDDVVSEYFEFVMLSHRWGKGEPLLRDIQGKCVYDLGDTDGEAKLQKLCILALRRNFQWAWSDTFCIDKDSSAELQEAIESMFSWYHWSSLTIVHLSDVLNVGSLVGSVWFTRGWTLQELLASHTVLFYTHNWSPCMGSNTVNHKMFPPLLAQLQNATGIAKQHLTNFSPGMDDARSRLHWASGPRTTRPEDIAYSLFGILQVHLPIIYGETAQNALGRLLAEIISRSGDVSILDWVGERSSFNSCFPVDLAPYQAVPHFQPISGDSAGRNNLDIEKALKLYGKLAKLPRAGFVNGKLSLPCTAHPFMAVKLQGSSIRPLRYIYEIHASRLRPLNVALSIELDESVGTYTLVRPWHPKSLEQRTRYTVEAALKLLEQLEQPFNALLLKRSFSNGYTRIACDCTITARVQDLASTLDSEVLIPEIV